MDAVKHMEMVCRLETPLTVTKTAITDTVLRLLHASVGISSEGGEFADHLKKILYAGRPVDRVNIIEEMGDLLWYIQLALHAIQSTIPEALQTNYDKLYLRHGEKLNLEVSGDYSKRDLGAERALLERSAAVTGPSIDLSFGDKVEFGSSKPSERLVPRDDSAVPVVPTTPDNA